MSGRPSAALGVLAFFALACAPEPTRIQIELPPRTGMQSMLVAVEHADAIVRLHAASLVSAPTIQIQIQDVDRDVLHVHSLLFERPLEAFDIPAGDLKILPEGPTTRVVPTPDRILTAEVDAARSDDEAVRWVEVRSQEAATSVHIAKPAESCLEGLTEQSFELPEGTKLATAVVLDGATALLGTVEGRHFLANSEGVTEVDLGHPALPRSAVHRGADGRLWFAGADGVLVAGSVERGATVRFVETASTVSLSGEPIRWLTGPTRSSDPFELFTLSELGTIERFDGSAWSRFDTSNLGFTGESPWGCLAWIGPREIVAANSSRTWVVRFVDGALVPETVSTGVGIGCVADIPGFGTVAGAEDGLFYRFDDATGWSLLGKAGFGFLPLDIVPMDDGFLAGGGFGQLARYSPRDGLCDRPAFVANISRILVFDGAFLMLTVDPWRTFSAPQPQITWLTRG